MGGRGINKAQFRNTLVDREEFSMMRNRQSYSLINIENNNKLPWQIVESFISYSIVSFIKKNLHLGLKKLSVFDPKRHITF